MSPPIERPSRSRHNASQRQLDQRAGAREDGGAVIDLHSERMMKIQTDLKAGGGLLDLDVCLDIDIDVSLFGGCKKKSRKGC